MSFPFEAEKKPCRKSGALSFHVAQVSFFAFPLLVQKEKCTVAAHQLHFARLVKIKSCKQVLYTFLPRQIAGMKKGKEMSQKVSITLTRFRGF